MCAKVYDFRDARAGAIASAGCQGPRARQIVICRELRRNRHERVRRPRVLTGAERRRTAQHLWEGQWSPEQIAGRCRAKGLPMVGTTRIYRVHSRGQRQDQGKSSGTKRLTRCFAHRCCHSRSCICGCNLPSPDLQCSGEFILPLRRLRVVPRVGDLRGKPVGVRRKTRCCES